MIPCVFTMRCFLSLFLLIACIHDGAAETNFGLNLLAISFQTGRRKQYTVIHTQIVERSGFDSVRILATSTCIGCTPHASDFEGVLWTLTYVLLFGCPMSPGSSKRFLFSLFLLQPCNDCTVLLYKVVAIERQFSSRFSH